MKTPHSTRRRLKSVAHVTRDTFPGKVTTDGRATRTLADKLAKELGVSRPQAFKLAVAEVTRARVEEAREGVRNVFCPTGDGGGVDPHCSPGGAPTYTVSLSPRNDAGVVQTAINRILGPGKTIHDVARLTGVPPGATIDVGVGSHGKLECHCRGDGWEVDTSYHREDPPRWARWNPLSKPAPILTATIEGAYVTGVYSGTRKVPPGFGTDLLTRQVKELSGAGFQSIDLVALRTLTSNGHYTWARLGFDGDLDDDHREPLPHPYNSMRRVSDVVRTPEGRGVWRERGTTFHGTFDLRRGSLSRTVLDAYLVEKGKAPTTNVRPTPPAFPPGMRPLADDEVIDPRYSALLDRVWDTLGV